MQKKRKRRERKHWGEKRERVGTWWGKKGKYIFLYVRSESKVHLQTGLGAARNLGTCCCVHSKWRGGGKNKKNKNESSPIQLGEGTSTLRQGFIQEGLSPSLDERKSHSSSACVMYLSCVQMKCMCKFVYATGKLEGVSVIYMVNTVAPLTCCKRGGIFLSLFLHSFLCFFSPIISPRLPSSHPNQRTHRPLLGTPCPGNPPCTARYLRNTKMKD